KAYTPLPSYSHGAILIGKKLYILGGDANNTSIQFAPTKDDFFYLDVSAEFNTTNIQWTDLSNVVGIPKQSRAAVSASGPNKDIIFLIGGVFENSSYGIPLVYTFDTITVGTISDARAHHSSVLGLNNDHIIIYGGLYSYASPAVVHDLFVLDIRNKPYQWFTPNVSGFIFLQQYINTDMYILDIGDDSEYKWVTSFNPNSPSTSSHIPKLIQNGDSISTGTMIGAIIGTFIGSILLAIFALMVYRRYRRKHPRAIPTHGS
ncbi:9133_t:CDS:2, partial [Dentiscutata heterogama]